jgi:hypothetical protein
VTSSSELYCPFASNIHPLTRFVSEQTLQWAAEFELVAEEQAERCAHSERFTWLVGRFFPRAPLPALQLISDFTSWLFWHDDVCDETLLGRDPLALGQTFDRFFDILRADRAASSGPTIPSGPFEAALLEMRERFAALAPDAPWLLRFVTSVREYFDACIWEAQNRLDGIVPSVGSFISLRRCAGGMWIYLDFVEFCMGRSLPLPLRKHRDVQRLVQITNNVASWHNDLYSLAKETRSGDVHNLVTALQAELGIEGDEAIAVAVGYANAEVRAFVELRQKLTESGQLNAAALRLYIEGLEALMRGNLDWSMESGRYTDFRGADFDAESQSRNSDIRGLAQLTSSARRVAG